MGFGVRLTERVRALRSSTCIGLDPHVERLPPALFGGRDPATVRDRAELAAAAATFCKGVVDATADLSPSCKPQVAFFEVLGSAGVAALEEVVAYAKQAGMLVIVDAKRNDIGSTAEAYARGILDDDGPLGADAVTVNPYLGPESLDPFVARTRQGKGLFVLVRTSNPGAGVWQAGIAEQVADWIEDQNRATGEDLGPIGAVVGATSGVEGSWRDRMPSSWFLVPGYGPQGATADDVRKHARPDGLGSLVLSARAVSFPAKGADGPDWRAAIRARAVDFVADLRRVLPC